MAAGKWKEGLKATMPNYYAGIVDIVEEILEMHIVATQACFGTRSSVQKENLKATGKIISRSFL